MNKDTVSFYAGVFSISGLVMVLQILQSRIFSVTSWYHLSFLVISIAMFGLTMGALKIYKSPEEEQRLNYRSIARNNSAFFGFFICIGLLAQLYIPIISTNTFITLASLPAVAITVGLAYYYAGIVITICLTRSPYPVGLTYGVDLLGAGLGCILALVFMETVDAPSAILLTAGLAFLSSLCFNSKTEKPTNADAHQSKFSFKQAILFCTALTVLFGVTNIVYDNNIVYPRYIKNSYYSPSDQDYKAWNSISFVTVGKETVFQPPFLWGPSPTLPKDMSAVGKFLIIDGDAGTGITKFDGDFSKHSYLEYDVTNIAYNLPNIKKAAIIGVGGGRDLLSAKYFGVDEVTAMDVNPVQIDLLTKNEEFKNYTNLHNQPGVKILNEEARSWFRQNTEKLDLIQMSLIDTWAATGAGAFSLSENGLYTTEAWTIFMNDLSDHGVFTLSRWSSSVMDDAGRSLSVAMSALFNQGITDAKKHIIVINTENKDTLHSQNVVTLIISKTPFTSEQINTIEKTAIEKQFVITIMPNRAPPVGLLGDLLQAHNMDELNTIADKQFFDVSPSTDMRPFFFNQARISKPLDVTRLALKPLEEGHFVSMGQAKATFNLYIIILFSFLMVGFVIIMPLLKTVENKKSRFVFAGTLYFMLIGLGFMFMEISLLQALGVFLGHPIYGLSVVLFSLIISAGLGSFLSEKIPLTNLPKQIVWCLLTCGYGILMSNILGDVFVNFAETNIATRILISIAIMAPAGLLMGFGFPTGLRLTEKFDSRATSWFWGINGAAGVLGSSVAIACNISMGIDKTLMIASTCYALLIISFLLFSKMQKAN